MHATSVLPEVGERPVVLASPTGSGGEALLAALLAAPGAWDASPAFAEWARDVVAGARPDLTALAEAVRRCRDAVDWSRLPGDAVPRMLVAGDHVPAALAAVLELLPDAQVVHLHREPVAVLAAADDPAATAQAWLAQVEAILRHTTHLPDGRRMTVAVESLVAETDQELQRLLRALRLGWHRQVSERWRSGARALAATEQELEALLDDGEPASSELVERIREVDEQVNASVPALVPSLRPTTEAGSLTAVDNKLAELLRRLGASLLVSTYQTNRLISLRPVPGGLGVHLRAFDRPMGLAAFPGGLALGVRSEVIEFRDLPEAAAGLEPKGHYDACYLPRNAHVTGDIAVHDLAVGRDGLWVVATKFSCLATLDAQHSFVPQWKPPFVSALAPEDRCHLNGMAVVDGVPRYATALGVSDEPGGWRPGKASGGVLMEVPSGKVLVEGLSMPHSPRWHEGRILLLESGRGRLLRVDPASGRGELVAELPGFTRGLAVHGGHAFVGTSQARETATFGGLPVAERADLECGVWAVELATGRVVASVRFEDRIQELFEVAVLPGVKHPEVAEWGSDLARTSWMVPQPGGGPGR